MIRSEVVVRCCCLLLWSLVPASGAEAKLSGTKLAMFSGDIGISKCYDGGILCPSDDVGRRGLSLRAPIGPFVNGLPGGSDGGGRVETVTVSVTCPVTKKSVWFALREVQYLVRNTCTATPEIYYISLRRVAGSCVGGKIDKTEDGEPCLVFVKEGELRLAWPLYITKQKPPKTTSQWSLGFLSLK